MGGSPGTQTQYVSKGADAGLANSQAWQQAQSNPAIAQILSNYSQGKMSYQDAMAAANSVKGDTSQTSKSIKELEDKIAAAPKAGWRKDFQSTLGQGALGAAGKDPRGVWTELSQEDKNNKSMLEDQLATLRSQLKSEEGMGGTAGMDALALGTGTGSQLATDQVLNNSLYSGLFGKDGMQGQAQANYGTATNNMAADRQALMGRDESYGLTDQDLKAYGQASDETARLFGAKQMGLSQALSDRGLGAGASGVANQSFSNLYGNQMEQLKNAQMQIAQNRINTAKGLAETRMASSLQAQQQAGNLSQGLGQLGMAAQGQQYNQNLGGIQTRAGLAGNASAMAAAAQAQNQNTLNEFFNQQQASKSPGFLEQLGSSIASIPGAAAGGVAGALTGNFLKPKAGAAAPTVMYGPPKADGTFK
jgi:hypothetical protein